MALKSVFQPIRKYNKYSNLCTANISPTKTHLHILERNRIPIYHGIPATINLSPLKSRKISTQFQNPTSKYVSLKNSYYSPHALYDDEMKAKLKAASPSLNHLYVDEARVDNNRKYCR